MSKILAIHGIGQQMRGAHTLRSAWFDALRDGLHEVSDIALATDDFNVVGYGPVYRPAGARGVAGVIDADQLCDAEIALLQAWSMAAAQLSRESKNRDGDELPTLQGTDVHGRVRTSDCVQRALRQLGSSRFFAALNGPASVLKLVREAYLFLHDDALKQAILARVAEQVSSRTRIVIAHSLGSIVAYEALCRNPQWPVETLITIGSPLGIAPMIFDALTPAPIDGKGAWPAGLKRWVNIADKGDVVALEKKLAPLFGCVEDVMVFNGWHSHDARCYLTARETGLAVASAWREAAP